MSDRVEFWRDPAIDRLIEDIIEIFTKVEGVKLVRLSGMTNRARNISGKHDIPHTAIDGIIRKLNSNGIIKFDYISSCPHCGEISYIIHYEDDLLTKPKLCDTCNTLFALIEGSTISTLKNP